MNDEQEARVAVGFGFVAFAFMVVGAVVARPTFTITLTFPCQLPPCYQTSLYAVNPLFLLGGLFALGFFACLFTFKGIR